MSVLITLLGLRALFGALFGVLLLTLPHLTWSGVFARFAEYAVVDGLFAVVLAATFLANAPSGGWRWQRWLVPALMLCDAVVRLGAGVAVRWWPGIPYFPVTSVLFLGTIGALTAWLSVIELAVLAAADRRQHWRIHNPASSGFVLIAAGAVPMLLLGAKLMIAPPSSAAGLRLFFSGYMLATSCGLALAGVRSRVEARLRSQRPALFVLTRGRPQTLRVR
jgi:hypothetical protein